MRSDYRDYPSPRSTPRPTHDRANDAAYEHAVEQIVEHASPAYKKDVAHPSGPVHKRQRAEVGRLLGGDGE